MKNYFVSVIIPTFNRANYLIEAINSVLDQRYKHFEIIVVDDGSTDNTGEIIKQFGDKIRYFYQQNKGPSAARNTGIKNAKGNLIAFIDSDDVWLPEKLSQQVELFYQNHRLGLVSSAYYSCDSDLNVTRIIKEDKLREKKYVLEKLFIRNIFPTPTVVVRKECFEKAGLFNETYRFAEDWDLWMRIALEYDIAYIKSPLCKCRRHSKSITFEGNQKNFQDWENIIRSNFERMKRLDHKFHRIILFRKSLSWFYMNTSYHYYCKSDTRNEMKYLIKSLAMWPFLIDKKYILTTFLSKLIGQKTYLVIKNLFINAKAKL